MTPKVCAICFGLMAEMARALPAAESIEFIVHEDLLEDDDWTPLDWMNDVDVFLSSGYNALRLKSKVSKPVVSMEARLSDLLLALQDALAYDNDPLVVPFNEEFVFFKEIAMLLPIRVKQAPFKTPQQLREILLDYKNSGGRAVVVTGLGYAYAKEIGLKPFFIRPKGALLEYFNIAADMALSLRNAYQRNNELMTIINYYEKGVLLATGDIITICNPLAAKIFRYLNRPIVGMNLSEIIQEIHFISAKINLHNLPSPILHNLCHIGGKSYMLDFIPIHIKHSFSGIMINIGAMNDGKSIQRSTSNERNTKGFVAKYSFQMLSDKSCKFNKTVELARYYSQTEESIVILGESGVGKEVMAHAIHNNSKRAKYPFVAVNCSAMSEKLLESELFGYDEGAFTGAKRGGKEGIFEMANKGTIFLDEIGEINQAIQIKLLRAIQEKEIMRVGGTKVIHLDARIIAATNKNLWQLVEEKKFREDLYYRINVLELTIPPLRERREDIYTLFSTFLLASSPNINQIMDRHEQEITALLNKYDWPGNIRQLDNFAKMVAATMGEDQTAHRLLDAMDEIIQTWIQRQENAAANIGVYADTTIPNMHHRSFDDVKRQREFKEIQAALFAAGGNKQQAAKALGIDRSTLWRKLKRYRDTNT